MQLPSIIVFILYHNLFQIKVKHIKCTNRTLYKNLTQIINLRKDCFYAKYPLQFIQDCLIF
jgi:hypothetical protein